MSDDQQETRERPLTPEPQPSTSRAAIDDDVFKRPLAPPPKRQRIESNAGSQVAAAPAAPEAPRAPVVVNLLADVEQAQAVAKWENARQEKHRKYTNRSREAMQFLTAADLKSGEKITDAIARKIVDRRSFAGSYIYVCVDALIAAVEIRDNPVYGNFPIGVVYKRHVCSVNGLAMDLGVQTQMPIKLARRLCPNIKLIGSNFDKYNRVTLEMKSIIRHYDPKAAVSMNYADINVTNYIKKFNQCIADDKDKVSLVVEEIRQRIFKRTGLRIYAGVGPTPLIAKLASLSGRPYGTYIVPHEKEAIDSFLRGLPVTQFCGISGKIEHILKVVKLETTDRIWTNRGSLPYLVNNPAVEQIMSICLGCAPEFVGLGILTKENDGSDAVAYSKWMYSTRKARVVEDVCKDVCVKLEENLKKLEMAGKLVTVRASVLKAHHKKMWRNMRERSNEHHVILETVLEILEAMFAEDPGLIINGVKISVSDLALVQESEEESYDQGLPASYALGNARPDEVNEHVPQERVRHRRRARRNGRRVEAAAGRGPTDIDDQNYAPTPDNSDVPAQNGQFNSMEVAQSSNQSYE